MFYSGLILYAAKVVGVSGSLLLAICTQESGLRNVYVHYDGGSPSYGVCQIKAGTARLMGFRGPAKELMKPAVNAYWAAQYLKFQMDRYDRNIVRAISAYNAGSYAESKVSPGKPRNLVYVNRVLVFHRRNALASVTSDVFLHAWSPR